MWQVVVEQFLPVFAMIVTPPATVFVGLLFHRLAKKWHLEAALVYEDKVDELVIKGIKAAEQKSLAAIKKGGDRTPGEKKVEEALQFVNAQLASMKLPEKASAELSTLIESHIFDGAKDKPAAADVTTTTTTPDVTTTTTTTPAA